MGRLHKEVLRKMEESGVYASPDGDQKRVVRDAEDFLNHSLYGRDWSVIFGPRCQLLILRGPIQIVKKTKQQHQQQDKIVTEPPNKDRIQVMARIDFPVDYPKSPPSFFVGLLKVHNIHPNVGHGGRMRMDYLQEWKSDKDNNNSNKNRNIIDMVGGLISIFEAQPPRCYYAQNDENSQTKQQQDQAQPRQHAADVMAHNLKRMLYSEKAWKFARQVINLNTEVQKSLLAILNMHNQARHEEIASKTKKMQQVELVEKIDTVATNDLVWMTEQVLGQQRTFLEEGGDGGSYDNTSTTVDIGYHYTMACNMEQISTDGLLTRSERNKIGVTPLRSNRNGYGDGVYTCHNPFSCQKYGDTGLMVARLYGTTTRDVSNTVAHSFIHDKKEIMVARSSSLCIPLIRYPTALLSPADGSNTALPSNNEKDSMGEDIIYKYHQQLQALIDDVFNDGNSTLIQRPKRPEIASLPSRPISLAHSMFNRLAKLAPSRGPEKTNSAEVVSYTAPETLSAGFDVTSLFQEQHHPSSEACVICLSPLMAASLTHVCENDEHGVVALKKCRHQFHRNCIMRSLENDICKRCPCCNQRLHEGCEPQGRMPSGTMRIVSYPKIMAPVRQQGGASQQEEDTIVIQYVIPPGIQKMYHENPGQSHAGTTRKAYVPGGVEGRDLLRRLVYAFKHGLIFTVGTSLTSGRRNQVTWASIHHKTTTSGGGSRGFPDPAFFSNCNSELDALGVPKARRE